MFVSYEHEKTSRIFLVSLHETQRPAQQQSDQDFKAAVKAAIDRGEVSPIGLAMIISQRVSSPKAYHQ